MISITFASRVKYNPDSNIERLLQTAVDTTTEAERKQIEFLVKYDRDDDLAPKEKSFNGFPFPYKLVTYDRGEGRSFIHHFVEYLFTLHSPQSRFIMLTADDFFFTRPGWVTEILNVENKYSIIMSGHCPVQGSKPRLPIESINYYNIGSWKTIFGNSCSIYSVPIIEVCQNFGWHSSIDAWTFLLAAMLRQDFGVDIYYHMEAFYERTAGGNPGQNRDEVFGPGHGRGYNLMEQSGWRDCQNLYWFDLVRQQAKNIYLNMKEDGLV